ncbi:hypothetical protein IW262DRAFT_1401872 [Armillaria fumosa]|nr:hypothetical protein IW262DRAFT_1401872 [Armillaria fumosa]
MQKSNEQLGTDEGRDRQIDHVRIFAFPFIIMSCRHCGFVLEPQPQNTKSSDSLASQILRGSRPLLDSDHALLNAEIVDLERPQSLYAAQFQEIQLCRCAVLKALELHKSIYAPIRRLPHDILIEIFDSVCDSWWQEADENWRLRQRRDSLDVSGPLWVLGRVCGLWRDTLHSSPVSWARKLVVRAPFSAYVLDILQTYLEHIGKHFLNLHVDCTVPTQDKKIMSLLVRSCHRWKSLRINAKHHMSHLESISHFPALQKIDVHILERFDSDYRSDALLGTPRLWHACLHGLGISRIRLPPGVTHFSGSITCPEDLRLLSQLPNLRRCHLGITAAMVATDAPVVTVTQLSHLYAVDAGVLKFLSTPLLSSLTIGRFPVEHWPPSTQESVTLFLHRSGCHLESLSVSKAIFTSEATPSRMFVSEACSTISCFKLELPPQMIDGIVEALASPSVLPNLRHLILCISQHLTEEWAAIIGMVRSCRNTGSLKLVEVQFRLDEQDCYPAEDIRALSGGDFEMRVEEWNPPSQDHLYLWQLS